MYTVLLVIHLMVTLSLIGIILVQRSASDGMGLSGSSSNSFMSGRSAATFITRATSILGAVFILCSLAMGIIIAHSHNGSLIDKLRAQPMPSTPGINAPAAPLATTVTPNNKIVPVTPSKPVVPRPE